jgi:hypothetical protein
MARVNLRTNDSLRRRKFGVVMPKTADDGLRLAGCESGRVTL